MRSRNYPSHRYEEQTVFSGTLSTISELLVGGLLVGCKLSVLKKLLCPLKNLTSHLSLSKLLLAEHRPFYWDYFLLLFTIDQAVNVSHFYHCFYLSWSLHFSDLQTTASMIQYIFVFLRCKNARTLYISSVVLFTNFSPKVQFWTSSQKGLIVPLCISYYVFGALLSPRLYEATTISLTQ